MEPTKKLYELLKCVYSVFRSLEEVYELLKCVCTESRAPRNRVYELLRCGCTDLHSVDNL